MNRWLFWWRNVRREMWVRASLYAGTGVAAALLAVFAAPWVPEEVAERLGGESVSSILTILASSLLGVATFSAGAMVTAYTAVSQAATPRVAALVTSDKEVQQALATFVGAFLYAIVAVTAVNAHYYGQEGRAILFLFSLGVVCLVAFRLLAWINRLSSLARVGHMIDLAEEQARTALKDRRKSPYLGGRPGHIAAAFTILADETGYVQNVDPARLQAVAEDQDCNVEILAAPGAYVRCGDPVAAISRGDCDEEGCDDFRSAFAIGGQRSFDQDPRFGLIVLGEIAGKALSPGVNDPGTAIQVMGAAVRALDEWAALAPDDAEEVRYPRVWAPRIDDDDLVADVFGPPARYGAGDVAVAVRLQKLLHKLARDKGPMAAAARRQAKEALERSRLALPLPADVAQVEKAAKTG
ncbi:MAG: DUF2254 domain-containing protein [Alphaproteobacteria bacterium]|nr:DUF2254 domain-containing protein [Alphaproteobacteria bacterium]MBU2378995.1 DUF2254 domain-containing protein [Alphaproteobacteria bacterium]